MICLLYGIVEITTAIPTSNINDTRIIIPVLLSKSFLDTHLCIIYVYHALANTNKLILPLVLLI